jgi:hypothetical protein
MSTEGDGVAEVLTLTRDVPVVADVDVLVAGGGLAGCMAAVAAAREGAKTAVVERFGYLGGNMGPGMYSGGGMCYAFMYDMALLDGAGGLVAEFMDRCQGYSRDWTGRDYFRDHQVVAYIWAKMMQENNVATMLNTFISDPLMAKKGSGPVLKTDLTRFPTVTGLIVENKSGTQAIRAKVVIDATGDADVAFRAGAPCDDGAYYSHPGCYFAMGGVDVEAYEAWLKDVKVSDDDIAWAGDLNRKLGSWGAGSQRPFFGLFRKAWEAGEYHFIKRIGDIGAVTVDHGYYRARHGIVGAQVGVADRVLNASVSDRIFSGDQAVMNALETGCREYIFETAQFFRRHVPGFAQSHLHVIAPYFHTRGGRSIVAERVLTVKDVEDSSRFDDVVFVAYPSETPLVRPEGHDFPYRQLVPKGVNGLLAAGRAAIIQPPTNRTRWKVLLMGQIAGVAAAQAARDDVTPLQIDVRQLQRTLHGKYHTYLGPDERLRQLGIID